MLDVERAQAQAAAAATPVPDLHRTKESYDLLNLSTQAMIHEHNRIAALYLYNAEMGERRVAVFLTIVSIAAGGLVGLSQLKVEPQGIVAVALVALAGICLLGLVTFKRLIERRILGTELLRAINRCHAYFVSNDPALEPFYYWPVCDDIPAFKKTNAIAGLMGAIAALNSLFAGVLVSLLIYMVTPQFGYLVESLVGLAAAAIFWSLQQRFEAQQLAEADRYARHNVQFPSGKSAHHANTPSGHSGANFQ